MIDVTKQLMIDAIKGCQPSFKMMQHPFCKEYGVYHGSYGVWDWNHRLANDNNELTVEYLIEVYKDLKAK